MSFVPFSFRVILMPDGLGPTQYVDPGPIAPQIIKWLKDYADGLGIEDCAGFTVQYDSQTGRFKGSCVFQTRPIESSKRLLDDIIENTKYADERFTLDKIDYLIVCKEITV
jgi:hypothetical protein